MQIIVTFHPGDGTGSFTKVIDLQSELYDRSPDEVWYFLVRGMKEILHSWRWRLAGKPTWVDEEKRLAWKADAAVWTGPIDKMMAAVQEKKQGG